MSSEKNFSPSACDGSCLVYLLSLLQSSLSQQFLRRDSRAQGICESAFPSPGMTSTQQEAHARTALQKPQNEGLDTTKLRALKDSINGVGAGATTTVTRVLCTLSADLFEELGNSATRLPSSGALAPLPERHLAFLHFHMTSNSHKANFTWALLAACIHFSKHAVCGLPLMLHSCGTLEWTKTDIISWLSQWMQNARLAPHSSMDPKKCKKGIRLLPPGLC